MLQHLADHQYVSGIITLVILFAVMLTWERLMPRQTNVPVHGRRLGNLALLGTDAAVITILFPVTAVGTALIAAEHDWGIFNAWQAPYFPAFIVSLLLLDLAIYCQHRLFHALHWLWPIHRVHHTDLQVDATTSVRFHPAEVIIYTVLKMAVVLLLGAPVAAVAVFEFLLIAASLFYHGNVRISAPIENVLRTILITPDVHRIHHSAWRPDTDSNFGNLFIWWDRLLGTYHAAPSEGYENMRIGLDGFTGTRAIEILQLLKQPFTRSATLQ